LQNQERVWKNAGTKSNPAIYHYTQSIGNNSENGFHINQLNDMELIGNQSSLPANVTDADTPFHINSDYLVGKRYQNLVGNEKAEKSGISASVTENEQGKHSADLNTQDSGIASTYKNTTKFDTFSISTDQITSSLKSDDTFSERKGDIDMVPNKWRIVRE